MWTIQAAEKHYLTTHIVCVFHYTSVQFEQVPGGSIKMYVLQNQERGGEEKGSEHCDVKTLFKHFCNYKLIQ